MPSPRVVAAVLLCALLLAGCAAPPPAAPAEAGPDANATPAQPYALAAQALPPEEVANATLGEAHEHDLWGEAEELVLLDAEVEAGLCEGPVDAAFYLMLRLFNDQEAAYGCARLSLPEGVVVPEGAGDLTVEVDATQALKSGSYHFQFRNKAREEETEPTTEAKHAWTIPLTPDDWDLPHAAATTWVMYVGARGPAGAFEGPVHARIVAHKLEGWAPVLAVAHVDHWRLASMHDFAAPGVMRLGDAEGRVKNVDPARITGGAEDAPIPLSDVVPPGTAFLVVVADTTSTDCAPVLRCWYVPELVVGGYERTRFGALLHEEGARRVYAWSVPNEVPADSVYANESTTHIRGRIDACLATDAGGPSCGFASMASNEAAARLQSFAWRDEVDLALLATLAGPPP